LVSQTFASQPM